MILVLKNNSIYLHKQVNQFLIEEILCIDNSKEYGELSDFSEQSFSDKSIALYVNLTIQKENCHKALKDRPSCITPLGVILYGTVVVCKRHLDENGTPLAIDENGLSRKQIEIIKSELFFVKPLNESEKMLIDLAFLNAQ